MPRQSGTSIMNNFVRGLVTEATALSFPENACTEVNNVVFDPTGRITRRPGIDFEADAVATARTTLPTDAYTSYIWNTVGGDGNRSLLVYQTGDFITFYDISETTSVGDNRFPTGYSIDLDGLLPSGSTASSAMYECSYAAVNGDLIIVNPVIDPFFVSLDNEVFTLTIIRPENRDFEGLDDGLEVDDRPTGTVAGFTTSNPNKIYNLYNQGWHPNPAGTDAIIQWDTARTDLPSNSDYIGLFRQSANDAFDTANVVANASGNRPAPKGHFIINSATVGQQAASDADGFGLILSTSGFAIIDRTLGSIFTNFDTRTSAAFDGNNYEDTSTCAARAGGTPADAYIGKDFGGSPQMINRATYYPSTNQGYLETGTDITLTLYAKNTLPASGTDGTNLGSVAFTDDTSPRTITSSDPTTAYRYVWFYVDPTVASDIRCSEVVFYSGGTFTYDRWSSVEAYAGRVFYGGLEAPGLGNNIYFSQIIESKDQYGKCYQKNDPTNEFIPDLLPDDGGVIKILGMGSLKRLFSYQSALLAFANNGIWLISGSSGSNFKADDYVVKKISAIGITSAQSVCSIKGLPAWWGEDGIYTVTYDPNYDSFTPTSLTLTVLDRFYQEIPSTNRKYAKGAYDETNQIAYWLYSSNADLSSDFYQYDSVLCLDGKSKAFYTWDLSSSTGASPVIIRGFEYVKPATRNVPAKMKYQFTKGNFLYHGEIENYNYIDWEAEGSSVNYDSTFVTGYKLDGQTQRYFQPNYVFVFLEAEETASCYMQALFDFTTSSAEGKWSTLQQIYNENLTNRGINFRRMKVRGKGRALQLRFESEEQKPFTIIGWSIYETTNAAL